MVDLTDRSADVIKWLGIAFLVWFIGANTFLYFWGRKIGWRGSDYFSIWVVMATLLIVALLEYLVYY